jgi:hypothetical protein
MRRANVDIRKLVKASDIHYWEIADKYGVADVTLSKMLRHELSPEKKERIFKIIKGLKAEREREREAI